MTPAKVETGEGNWSDGPHPLSVFSHSFPSYPVPSKPAGQRPVFLSSDRTLIALQFLTCVFNALRGSRTIYSSEPEIWKPLFGKNISFVEG